MDFVAKTYSERALAGKVFAKSLPLSFLFMPFIYLTALLGCWKYPKDFDSYRLGGVDVSMYLTLFFGGVVYAVTFRILLDVVLGR